MKLEVAGFNAIDRRNFWATLSTSLSVMIAAVCIASNRTNVLPYRFESEKDLRTITTTI